MYLARLKTLLVEAIKLTFDDEYPEPNFRNIHASIEYPIEPQEYPGIWVDFEPAADLTIIGVDHHEYTHNEDGVSFGKNTRWRYSGYATFTVAALSSLERDRIYDELVRVLAFGRQDPGTIEFRQYIEDNEFIACNFNFDAIITRGFSASPGTPWGTDEMIYEVTLNMECLGEFVSDAKGYLLPLSAIVTYPYRDDEPDPFPTGEWM